MVKKAFLIIFSFIVLGFAGCVKMPESHIVGKYESDKFSVRDTAVKTEEFRFLLLKADKNFELSRYKDSDKINGIWEIVESKNEREAVIQFNFSNKKIKGLLKETILSFEYPNEFHDGRFESLLYVRLIR